MASDTGGIGVVFSLRHRYGVDSGHARDQLLTALDVHVPLAQDPLADVQALAQVLQSRFAILAIKTYDADVTPALSMSS